MSTSMKERISADFDKAKETANLKAARIREIFRAAGTEAMAEVKAGSSEVHTIAREAVDAAVQAGKERKEFAAVSDRYAKLKAQLARWDTKLIERYGDRYQKIKEKLERYWQDSKAWYSQTKSRVDADGVDPIQKQQQEAERNLSQIGATAARQEFAVKEYFRNLWQTTFKR